jgi:hypothetical protein
MKLHGEEIKAGDKVWDIIEGWVIVERIDSNNFPIVVSGHSYNSKGKDNTLDINPTIFWDEVHITPPPKPKPKPEIDWSKVPENTLVRVWDRDWENHRIAEYHGYDTDLSPLHHWIKGTRSNNIYKHCELHESVTPLPEWYK